MTTELLITTIQQQRMNDAQSLLDELKRSLSTLSAADRCEVFAELSFLAGRKPMHRAA